ncbi:hypothetical protein D3C81_1520910 [compost metagenome]
MGVLMQGLRVEHAGHAALARLPFVLMAQQVLVGDDVCPMVTTGIVHAQQHLAESSQAGQGFQGLSGQGGNAEYNDP